MTYPWLEAVETEFSERLANGNLPHALLLSGAGGTGKHELAKGFIASLLCAKNTYPACDVCRSCQLLKTGAHPEAHIITFEENNKTGKMRTVLVVEQVRRLIASMCLTSTISERKTALIFPAEAMHVSTANALLKTLEEPPGDAVLILVSDDPLRLPATIRSRCQRLNVRTPDPAQAVKWLSRTTEFSEQQAEDALLAAAGSPLWARDILEDESLVQYQAVKSALQGLQTGTVQSIQVMADLSEIDPARLWKWISLLIAEEVKHRMAVPAAAAQVSRLQAEADRNRRLLSTPVRKDLLLQDWLIQWARIRA